MSRSPTISEFIEHSDNAFHTVIFQEEDFEETVFDAYEVRDSFLEFLTSIMRDYNRFWIYPNICDKNNTKHMNSMKEIWEKNKFLQFHNA
jgi:hypothetical protein